MAELGSIAVVKESLHTNCCWLEVVIAARTSIERMLTTVALVASACNCLGQLNVCKEDANMVRGWSEDRVW